MHNNWIITKASVSFSTIADFWGEFFELDVIVCANEAIGGNVVSLPGAIFVKLSDFDSVNRDVILLMFVLLAVIG